MKDYEIFRAVVTVTSEHVLFAQQQCSVVDVLLDDECEFDGICQAGARSCRISLDCLDCDPCAAFDDTDCET